MSTINETLKLALDALINAVPCTSEQVKEQVDSIAALRAALRQSGQDAQDAARYRFLRSALTTTDGTFSIGVDSPDYSGRWALEGDEADQAIDAAISKESL